MIWRKLTPYQESALFALLEHADWLGHGPDTEFIARPHEHLDAECYLHVVDKEDYSGVPGHWQTLELLEDLGFVHRSSKTGNFCLHQDAWEYRDWQRLPKLRRWLKAQWAMSRNEVRSAVISAIVSLIVSLIFHWLT
jgi:hypothetical protein